MSLRFTISFELARDDDTPQRESATDALVERAEPVEEVISFRAPQLGSNTSSQRKGASL